MKIYFKNIISQWFKDLTVNGSTNDQSFCYQVKYSNNAGSSDYLPMLIALHGDGDTPENFYQTALNELNVQARIILITAPISHELGKVWPYSAAQYTEYGKSFCDTVTSLAIKYPTANKPILFGFSGGGAMAYYQAIKHGDHYAYIFPISGLLFKEQLGNRLSRTSAKVFSYHGKSDEVVSFSAGKKAIKLLKKKGVNVTFTAFEGGHHGLFFEMKSEITQNIENKLKNLQN